MPGRCPRICGSRTSSACGLALRWRPLDAVGLYVPGGTAAYPSSVLMNAIPAKVAGVRRVVMVAPTPDGAVSPLVLAAAGLAGVDEVYRIGGAQAVAALALGTASIARVDKIVGPGNAYVAEAKRQVFGRVGIDMIAGPSEVVIVAEAGAAPPAWLAADLLAQAEHDERAQSILIGDDGPFLEAIAAEVEEQLRRLPRAGIAGVSWAGEGALIRVGRLEEAAEPDRCAGAGASPARGPAGRGAGGAGPARGRDLHGRPHARGDRRLCGRAEPRAAHRPDGPLRLRARGPRLPETDHAARLRAGAARAPGAGGGDAGPSRGAGGACAGGGDQAGAGRVERGRCPDHRHRARREEHRPLEARDRA